MKKHNQHQLYLVIIAALMMWGAMRYGYKLISLLWAVVLMISIHSYQNYIPIYHGYTTQLTITSSSYLVFSFIVNYMAVLATRQRAVVRRIQRLAYVDPVVHLPNVRALNRALRDAPGLRFVIYASTGMEMLVKTMASCYGFNTSKTFSLAVTIAGTG
ncbi:hypothetical protein FA041_26930 [Escherichia coli]|nr:hypothetical protein [Escherichia coli]